jgi:glycosyltransferase involved in cell wall biosynthesis
MTKKKRILMCYHSAQFGGIEKQILDLIKNLSKDFDFIIACPDGPLVEQYIGAGAVKHINLKPSWELDLFYIIKLSNLCRKENIDIIHSHELLTGCLATTAGFFAGVKKRIYHVHTTFFEWKHTGIKKYLSIIPNFIANFIVGNFFATDVLALTNVLKEIRINKEKINKEKITIIPNGIELEKLHYKKEYADEIRDRYLIPEYNVLIGYISRFTEEKGHEILIRAFEKLNNNTSKYMLILAGGGRLLDHCKNLVKDLKIEDKVIFTEHFDESDKVKILSAIDVCVIPTLAEGFGIALIEAMANRRPIWASNIPVIKEVAADSIKYFKSDNIDDLIEKLVRIGEEDLSILGDKAFEQAQNYSMEKFAEAYRNLYLK